MIAPLLALVLLAGSPSAIESRCKSLMDSGELEMKKQTPEGFQAAIRIFDQLVLEGARASQVAGDNLEAQRKLRASVQDYDDCTARKTLPLGDFPYGDTQ